MAGVRVEACCQTPSWCWENCLVLWGSSRIGVSIRIRPPLLSNPRNCLFLSLLSPFSIHTPCLPVYRNGLGAGVFPGQGAQPGEGGRRAGWGWGQSPGGAELGPGKRRGRVASSCHSAYFCLSLALGRGMSPLKPGEPIPAPPPPCPEVAAAGALIPAFLPRLYSGTAVPSR